jgi:Putative transposase/Transposase zinc-binding domain
MEAEQKVGWNIFKQIFADHWEGFKERYPLYDKQYYDDLVEKMLACGNPEKMGYIEYRCMYCGQETRIVAMSCKCSLCLRCGKVYVDDWVSQISRMLYEGVIYRHIVLTVPKVLRKTFYNHPELLGPFMQRVIKCLDDFFSCVSGKKIKGGYIVVLQTHGRNGHYNPHLHIIATSGGLDEKTQEWVHLNYLPYHVLHKKWQWYLLEMLREQLDTDEIDKLVDYCYKRYPKGFVANVQKGDVPSRYKSLAKYLAKYVVSPPISIRRIDAYDGQTVTYHYRSHTTEKVETERVEAYTFIGRMIQHIFPKGFQRIRYYGVQATKTFEKIKMIIKEAVSKVKKVVKDAIKIIPRRNYRERSKASAGKDPFICSRCGNEMEIWKIWHPKYGVMYDELEEMKRGKYEQKEQAASIKGGDRCAIRASSRGVQIPLLSVWNGAYG